MNVLINEILDFCLRSLCTHLFHISYVFVFCGFLHNSLFTVAIENL